MTKELIRGERVHIIAYNRAEQQHIIEVLTNSNISLDMVDFFIHPTDDCWVRDNGPIFVFDNKDSLVITDWDFNGWGNKAPVGRINSIHYAAFLI
jgi:agmatine deiminase